MFYVISRGVQLGKNLTTAQRSSSKFAEEPVVLGKVLRRGSLPLHITEQQYRHNMVHLRALEKAGAIRIQAPEKVSEETKEAEEVLSQKESTPVETAPITEFTGPITKEILKDNDQILGQKVDEIAIAELRAQQETVSPEPTPVEVTPEEIKAESRPGKKNRRS